MTSSDEILKLEGVWRQFRRWKRRPTSIKEAFVRLFKPDSLAYEDFWALRDISLSIRRGEVIGFCGGNGSGKSTLLRIIARILQATHGRVTVRGKIATLLEVATGFQLDISGRENIILNAMLMGFTEDEIARNTPSIIEFADLGDFIDTPVKAYSAGMFMRLGFAIASHVQADILLIDEVLAVGDAEFQRKCTRWFETVRGSDTTVLVVSHDLQTLADVCDRVYWLDKGSIREAGDPPTVVKLYNPEFVLAPAAPPHPQETAERTG